MDRDGSEPPPFDRIGVVGAGAMGRGIARVAAQSGAWVTLSDLDLDAAERGRAAIADGLARDVARGRLTRADSDAALGRIRALPDLTGHGAADLVIEAATEDLDLKAWIFAALARAAPKAVLATNTSSLGVASIAAAAGTRPLWGLHLFNPANVMPLVEVVPPEDADAGATGRVLATLRNWGKTPVLSADSPGFIVNRAARPFYGEALAILAEGRYSAAAIDRAMTARGYPLGPFALIDLVGADVNLAATRAIRDAFGGAPRYAVFPPLEQAVAAGRLGRKTGAGFVTPSPDPLPAPAPPEIADRIEALLVNEALHLQDEGLARAEDIDTALTLGLNFPKGPFALFETLGPARLRAILADLAENAPPGLRPRYAVAPSLLTGSGPSGAAGRMPEGRPR